ncbi:glycosyltransferase family A protein [Providencia huaxiensis]|uniref:glycosyltransferase family A protein n=1 Tax=Providencia huaxiensis TaxID=2027290 RepID=UPI0032DA10FE
MSELTIIIPHFESYTSLDNLLLELQKTACIEVIVVDDGSNDSEKINKIKTKYPHVHFYFNQGPNSAGTCRNIGLRHVETDWVTFVDSDDKLDINTLSELVTSFKNRSDCEIIFCPPKSQMVNGNKSNRHLRYKNLVDAYNRRKNEDILYWYHVPWSKIYNVAFLKRKNIKFSDTIVSNDVIFSLTAGIACSHYTVSNVSFYTVIESSTSLTSSKYKSLPNTICRLNILKKYNQILTENGLKKYRIPLILIAKKLPILNLIRVVINDGVLPYFHISPYYIITKVRNSLSK